AGGRVPVLARPLGPEPRPGGGFLAGPGRRKDPPAAPRAVRDPLRRPRPRRARARELRPRPLALPRPGLPGRRRHRLRGEARPMTRRLEASRALRGFALLSVILLHAWPRLHAAQTI